MPVNARAFRASVSLAAVLCASEVAHAGGCSISMSPISFGSYLPVSFAGKLQSTSRSSQASVVVSCVGIAVGGTYSIALGPDANGSVNPRSMSGPASGTPMLFNIYLESSMQTPWGDGTTGGLLRGTVPVGDSRSQQFVYGGVPGGQSRLSPGIYSTTLDVTLRYDP